MTMTQSMQQFEEALDRFRSGDSDFFNKLYWKDVCGPCREANAMNCGRGHTILQTMERLMFSQPVDMEVG